MPSPSTLIAAGVSGAAVGLHVERAITTVNKPGAGRSWFTLTVRFYGLNANAELRFFSKYGAAAKIPEDGATVPGAGQSQEHVLEYELSFAQTNGVGGVNVDVSVIDITGLSNAGVTWEWELTENVSSAEATLVGAANGINGELNSITANLGTVLGRVDVATSSRLASAAYVAPDNANITILVNRLTADRALKLDNLDAPVSEAGGDQPEFNVKVS